MVSLDFHTHSQVSFQLINPRHRAPRALRSLDFLGARQVPRLLAAGKSSAGGCGLLPSCSSSELTKLALSQAIPALQAPRIALIIAAPLELWEGSTHSSHPVLLLYKSLALISNADENKPSVCLLWSLFFFFFPKTTIWRLILKSTKHCCWLTARQHRAIPHFPAAALTTCCVPCVWPCRLSLYKVLFRLI